MNKKFKLKNFLICLGGGILFAILFFFTSSAEKEDTWRWGLLCLGGGLLWAVVFYFVWMFAEKFQKPFSFENPKAQKKLLDYENAQGNVYEYKFFAHMHYGKGIKQEICESCIYFEKEKIHIAFCHFGKVRTFDIVYNAIDKALITSGNVLIICSSTLGNTAYKIKDITPQLKELLEGKGLYRETTDVLFVTREEGIETACLAFQYCKEEGASKKFDAKSVYAEDALFVHIDREEELFERYGKYLSAPNGARKLNQEEDFFENYAQNDCGVDYYTKEQTLAILKQIKEEKAKDYEVLAAWLERAATDYNGFFFSEIEPCF